GLAVTRRRVGAGLSAGAAIRLPRTAPAGADPGQHLVAGPAAQQAERERVGGARVSDEVAGRRRMPARVGVARAVAARPDPAAATQARPHRVRPNSGGPEPAGSVPLAGLVPLTRPLAG